MSSTPAASLRRIAKKLSRQLGELSFAKPVTHVYDPTDYAWKTHSAYLGLARRGIDAVFLGMNPGPFGMAQTGVPFGDPVFVRDWMGLRIVASRPADEHPKRPVLGDASTRNEVSGQRLWGFARERFDDAPAFFERFFVINYCPLCFLEESGRNRTPDKLPATERDAVEELCDAALLAMIRALEPGRLIGVGAFAEQRAQRALASLDVPIGRVLHPSPASPVANRGWAPQAAKQLAEQGIEIPA
ncbi:MAG: uracil-DNA glycosylase family protein [Acidobacteriota bacterium]